MTGAPLSCSSMVPSRSKVPKLSRVRRGCPRRVRSWPQREGHIRPRGVEVKTAKRPGVPAVPLLGGRPWQACTPRGLRGLSTGRAHNVRSGFDTRWRATSTGSGGNRSREGRIRVPSGPEVHPCFPSGNGAPICPGESRRIHSIWSFFGPLGPRLPGPGGLPTAPKVPALAAARPGGLHRPERRLPVRWLRSRARVATIAPEVHGWWRLGRGEG